MPAATRAAPRPAAEPGPQLAGTSYRRQPEPPGGAPAPSGAPAPPSAPSAPKSGARRSPTRTARQAGQGALALGRGRKPASVAGFLGGMVLWAVALQLIRYGPSGPGRWVAAKFWNATGPSSSGATPTPGGQSGSSFTEVGPAGTTRAPGSVVYPGQPPASALAPGPPLPGEPVIPPGALRGIAPGLPVAPR